MDNFLSSEKYRKYLIGIKTNETCFYAIWGLDLEDDYDKFLIKDNQVLLFDDNKNIKDRIKMFKPYFFDKENFETWLKEETFNDVYSSIEIKNLLNFSSSNIYDKEFLLSVLNSLNIIQDLLIQIHESKIIKQFDSSLIIDLKDFIHNNYFWKNKEKINISPLFLNDLDRLKKIFIQIYDCFIENSLIIH